MLLMTEKNAVYATTGGNLLKICASRKGETMKWLDWYTTLDPVVESSYKYHLYHFLIIVESGLQ